MFLWVSYCLLMQIFGQIPMSRRYVGQLLETAMKIEFKSPAIKNIDINHFAILIGLLNRIVRLMLSNMKLSCDGTQGETTAKWS